MLLLLQYSDLKLLKCSYESLIDNIFFFKSTAFFKSIFFLRLRLKSLQLLSNKIIHPCHFCHCTFSSLNISFIVSRLLKNVFEYEVDSPRLLFSSPQFLEQYVESQGYWWASVCMNVALIAVSRRVVKYAPWGREWCRKLQPGTASENWKTLTRSVVRNETIDVNI